MMYGECPYCERMVAGWEKKRVGFAVKATCPHLEATPRRDAEPTPPCGKKYWIYYGQSHTEAFKEDEFAARFEKDKETGDYVHKAS